MLSKCANPGCAASFRYLHQGKLFRLDAGIEEPGRETPKAAHRIEFFWLCAECTARMTLAYTKDAGVTLVPVYQKSAELRPAGEPAALIKKAAAAAD